MIPSKGLIKSWRVVDTTLKFIPILIVDGYKVRGVSRKNRFLISMDEIRSYIRNPEREESEFNLDNFESVAYINQLYATEFYKSLTDDDLFKSLFTRDYAKIQISFGENGPDEVEIEEEYWDRNSSSKITETEEDKELQKELKGMNIKPISKESHSMNI